VIDAFGLGLLGAHVLRRTAHDVRVVPLADVGRESKVRKLRLVGGSRENVGRLDVSVQNALMVRVIEGIGGLSEDAESFLNRQLAPALEEAGTFYFFHHEEVRRPVYPEVIKTDDRFVKEASKYLGFKPDFARDFFAIEILEEFDRDSSA
jgi:hypothetical protein